MALWERIRQDIEKAAEKTADWSRDRFASMRLTHFQLERKIRSRLIELGAHLYELKKRGEARLPADAKVKKLVAEIAALEDRLDIYEKSIRSIDQGEAKRRETGAKKKRPRGGKGAGGRKGETAGRKRKTGRRAPSSRAVKR